MDKHPGGRPTDYCQEILDKSADYLENFSEYGDMMPSIAGLSLFLDITRTTIYRWRDDEGKEEFSYILSKILTRQEQVLFNGGLSGDFNPAITKLALGKHGYHDKVDTNLSGGIGITQEQWLDELE